MATLRPCGWLTSVILPSTHGSAPIGGRDSPIAPSHVAGDWRSIFSSTSFPGVMSSAAGAVARWIAPFLTVAAVAWVGLVADPVHVGPAPTVRLAADEANPLAGAPFYVNPTSAAMRAAQKADPPSPELTAIADTPQAYWLVPGSSAATVAKYAGDAQAAGAMPVFALYGIPHRDCGSFAAGGFATAADYKSWIDGIAADIGASPAAIVVEPDALAMADCLSADQRQERYDLIRYAVDTLTRNPAAAVYIDAGHLRWHSPEDMAGRLNQAGVDHARGFSLNTANFFTPEDEIGYGEAISPAVGKKFAVLRLKPRAWSTP